MSHNAKKSAGFFFAFIILISSNCAFGGQISVINPTAGSAFIDTTPVVSPTNNARGPSNITTGNYKRQIGKKFEIIRKFLAKIDVGLFSISERDELLTEVYSLLLDDNLLPAQKSILMAEIERLKID